VNVRDVDQNFSEETMSKLRPVESIRMLVSGVELSRSARIVSRVVLPSLQWMTAS
jgi:hypothetical protein